MVSAFYNGCHSAANGEENPAVSRPPQRLTRADQNDLIAWVQVWHDAGCAVHPAKADGSKTPINVRHGSDRPQADIHPAVYPTGKFAGMPHPLAGQPNPEAGQFGYGWKRIATGDLPRLTVDQIAAHIHAGRADGIGVICGRSSAGVFMLEAEGRARDLLPRVRDAAVQQGCLHLLERLAGGCVDESPSGGLHFYARSSDGTVGGNTVLAARPNETAEHGLDVLFETRGQGGWSAVAPSAGRTHKSGKPYRFLRGGPSTIPTFSPEEIERLFNVFRGVDERPKPDPSVVVAERGLIVRRERPAGEILPGDDFNQRATWQEILTGWKWMHTAAGRTYLNRPGVDDGRHRAVIDENDQLCVFTTSTALPDQKSLSKFAAYAHLNHGGDFSAAARALWDLGYGTRGDDGDGGALVPVDPMPTPAGDRRTLADWRQEVAVSRVAAIATPGTMTLDRSPTGAGKTRATIEALRLASSSLTVLPTHANVREYVEEQRRRGIDAVAFPELTSDTCGNFETASHAQRLGLVAGAAVCPTCPFNRIPNPRYPGLKENGKPEPETIPGQCHSYDQYLGMMKVASTADHRVGTHERLRRSGKPAEGVQVVVIDETPEQVVAPTLDITVGELTPVETLAHSIRNHWHSEATPDQKSFAGAMLEVVAAVHTACRGITTAGHVRLDVQCAHNVPDRWPRLLFDAIRKVGVGRDLHADALTLVTKAAAGELLSLEIVTDLTRAGRLVHFVVGSWRPDIPEDAAVILLDATGNAADITVVVGRPVTDCTPDGHLPFVHPVVQIPDDISRGTSEKTVAGLVEAFLTAHPEVQRLGIIGHSCHVRALMEEGVLGGAARDRVAKWCYFGQGPDRASNDWHDDCDHLLRLGTPRANPGDYRRWLVQHGLHDAAGKIDGDWSPRDWEAVTVDGQSVTIRGYGYMDPDWRRAYVAVSRAAGQQADGRGRSRLPGGIPVTVLSNDPMGYPLAPSLTVDPAAARETAEIVRGLVSQQQGVGSAKTAIGIPYRTFCASGAVRAGDAVKAITAKAGIGSRAAQVRLQQCIDHGLLTRPARGWYALPGSPAVPPECLPAAERPAPEPAMVSMDAPSIVISASPPTMQIAPVDVAAAPAPPGTSTRTDTMQPAADQPVYALMELVEERAAILEFDAGMDRATADRLAREMVLGRDATANPAPTEPITAHVDVPCLHARTLPYVDAVVRRIPGTVTAVHDRPDRPQPRQPGVCQCGHVDWRQVPIHAGRSVRVDCGHCDRFGWFGVWHGEWCPGPTPEVWPPQPAATTPEPVRLSFDFLPAVTPLVAAC